MILFSLICTAFTSKTLGAHYLEHTDGITLSINLYRTLFHFYIWFDTKQLDSYARCSIKSAFKSWIWYEPSFL